MPYEMSRYDYAHMYGPTTGDRIRLAANRRAPKSRAGERLGARHGEPGRYAAALVDRGRLAHLTGEARDNLEQMLRYHRWHCGLLAQQRHLV